MLYATYTLTQRNIHIHAYTVIDTWIHTLKHTWTHTHACMHTHTHMTYIHEHTYTAQRREWKLSFVRQSVEAVPSTVIKLNVRKELHTNTTGEENPCNFLHAKSKETITQAIFSHRMETHTTAMPCLLTTIQKMGCDGLLMPWVVFTTLQHQREKMMTELSRAAFWLLQIQLSLLRCWAARVWPTRVFSEGSTVPHGCPVQTSPIRSLLFPSCVI